MMGLLYTKCHTKCHTKRQVATCLFTHKSGGVVDTASYYLCSFSDTDPKSGIVPDTTSNSIPSFVDLNFVTDLITSMTFK